MKILIEFDREPCIGDFLCVDHDPGHWEPGSDGKAVLVGGSENEPGVYVLEDETDEEGVEDAVAAGDACPVQIINVEDREAGEYLHRGFER